MQTETGKDEWLRGIGASKQLHSRPVQLAGTIEAEIAAHDHRVSRCKAVRANYPSSLDYARYVFRPLRVRSRTVERVGVRLVDYQRRRHPRVVARQSRNHRSTPH